MYNTYRFVVIQNRYVISSRFHHSTVATFFWLFNWTTKFLLRTVQVLLFTTFWQKKKNYRLLLRYPLILYLFYAASTTARCRPPTIQVLRANAYFVTIIFRRLRFKAIPGGQRRNNCTYFIWEKKKIKNIYEKYEKEEAGNKLCLLGRPWPGNSYCVGTAPEIFHQDYIHPRMRIRQNSFFLVNPICIRVHFFFIILPSTIQYCPPSPGCPSDLFVAVFFVRV